MTQQMDAPHHPPYGEPAPWSPPAPRPPLRDRVLGLRAVAGVALASLVLGGAGGAILGAVSSGADTQNGPGGRGGFGGPGGQFGPPNGTGTQPNGTVTQPNGTGTQPNGTGTQPNGTGTQPNVP